MRVGAGVRWFFRSATGLVLPRCPDEVMAAHIANRLDPSTSADEPLEITGIADALVLRNLPFDVPAVHVDALWHQRMQHSSAHGWLRKTVARARALSHHHRERTGIDELPAHRSRVRHKQPRRRAAGGEGRLYQAGHRIAGGSA